MRHKPKNQRDTDTHIDAVVAAPFGSVEICVQGIQVTITLSPKHQPNKASDNKTAASIANQIEAYLHNVLNGFNLPIFHRGTPFQQKVWHEISKIPLYETRTYSELAAELKSSPRAVANACGANHLPLVVPCHRVVAKNGLGGFMQGEAGGETIKQWLLEHEGINV